jgi:hypothetical protein
MRSDVLPIRTFWPSLQISEIDDRAKDISSSIRIWKVEKFDILPTNCFQHVILSTNVLRNITLKSLPLLPSPPTSRRGLKRAEWRQKYTRSSASNRRAEHDHRLLNKHVSMAEATGVNPMVSLEKAVFLDTKGLFSFRAPRDFAFSRETLVEELAT